ncbi:MAG: hypothetical protein AAFQ42_07035 [Pseudomonadota bacterium]
MSSFTVLTLYGIGLGFTIAGVAVTAYELVSARRLAFPLSEGCGIVDGICGFLLRVLGGPYLIARHLVGLEPIARHPALIGAGGLVVAGWSFSLGILAIATLLVR